MKVCAAGLESGPNSSPKQIPWYQLRSFLPCSVWLHKHRLISSTNHQCVKGRLNGRPIRILANPNPFNQGEVNFVEMMFYDKLRPDDKSPTPRTRGAPVLEEEGGGYPRSKEPPRQKRQKKETRSSGSRECVVVQEPGGRLIYHL